MKYIIRTVWEIPQILLGLFILAWFGITGKIKKRETYDGVVCFWIESKTFSGISLGYIHIINLLLYNDRYVRKHELGHSYQSVLFGPLYLLAIGVPSLIRNIISRNKRSKIKNSPDLYKEHLEIMKWYYSGYPEKWADEIGEVTRPWTQIRREL